MNRPRNVVLLFALAGALTVWHGGPVAVTRAQSTPPTGDAAVPPAVTGPLALVNIMQGTDSTGRFSHGNTLPLVSPPWSMTDWCVQNRGGIDEHWLYAAKEARFVGFRATHQPSPWWGDYGDFMVTPQTGAVALRAEDRACDYDPAATVMRPDYVRVRLDRYHVTAELTASERCGVLRLQFDPADKVGRLVFDLAGDGQFQVQGDRLAGFTRFHSLPAAGDFACSFVGQLDRPITGGTTIGHGRQTGKGMAYVEFDVSKKPTVEVRFGTSYLGADQAWRNLNVETKGGFDAVRGRTAAAWAEKLGRITVGGGAEGDRATFYTCLYRAMKFPHKIYELNAAGKPVHYGMWDGRPHDGVAYTDSGLWDTFRTQMPFLSIAYPEQLGEIVNGWLNAYREGGWLPQWPSPGGFRGMVGSHADAMLADAMSKGIQGFDYETAYAALRHDAFALPPKGPNPGGREGMDDWLKLGYLPADSAQYWVSTSLDYAYDDWCVAQAAKITGQTADYRTLMRRAQNYRKLWDPSVKFMRARDAHGNFVRDFDEFAWGGGYTEGGPWQSSWAVEQDVAGLADLAGGPAAFAGLLDHLFHQPPTFHPGAYGGVIHEMTEFAAVNMGQFAANNQPSFHIPYLYAAVGQPWKTEYWTRRACRELFNAGPDGYCGDEDNGSNASWYLLSSMGLYALTPGQPQYVLTSPVFTTVKIDLGHGKTFTVSAPDNSPDKVYVQSRTLDGKPDGNTWISQKQITSGGTVVDTMGDKPAERTVTPAELPYSAKTDPAAVAATAAAR